MVDDSLHQLLKMFRASAVHLRRTTVLSVYLLIFTLAFTVGCKRKQRTEAVAVTVPASEVAASVGIQPSDLPSQKTLYDAIAKYMAANGGRAAKDVDELVQKGYLKPLPKLPAGKRYELDQRAAVLGIVNQ